MAEATRITDDFATIIGNLDQDSAGEALGRLVAAVQRALPPELARRLDGLARGVLAFETGPEPYRPSRPDDIIAHYASERIDQAHQTGPDEWTYDGSTGGPIIDPDSLSTEAAAGPETAPESEAADDVPPAPAVDYLAGAERFEAERPPQQAKRARARTRKATSDG
jgi:hypothetical protein